MVISSILNHQQPDSDQLKICLDNELGAEGFLVTKLKDAHYQTEQNKKIFISTF